MPKLVKKSSMQIDTCKQSDVVADANALLCFPSLPFPSFAKNPSIPYPPRVVQENSNYPRI